jgi:DNA-binding response OmpR family regulator
VNGLKKAELLNKKRIEMSQPKKEKDYVGSILIVDDEPKIREALGSLLSEEGYRTDFAENGHVGYEKARELIPDLIILDVMMPGIDGFEVCRKIRAESPLAQVPIIMITAVSDDRSRLRSIQSGADEFISKPFDYDELLAKIKKHHDA